MRKAGLLAFVAGIALVVMAAATPAYADPPGNNGTVKIHAEPGESEPIMANEPHVCTFHLHGFNFDASSTGTWSITAWPPTGDGSTVVRSGIWGPASSTGEWRTSAMSLADGHYKLAWQQTDPSAPGGAKSKVFWVECQGTTGTASTTGTSTGGSTGMTTGTTTGTTGEETTGTTTGTTGEETTGSTTGTTGEETSGTTTGTTGEETTGTTSGTTGASATGTTGESTTSTTTGTTTGAVTTGTSTAGTTGGAEAATTGATTGGAAAATTGGAAGGTEAATTGATAAGVAGVPNLPSTSTSSEHAPLTLIGLALMLMGAAVFLMRRVAAMR